ncbi:uncharacterized protein LOC130899377 [Diorhabda carinulata]|uniref:uncharacterized protein LOC130899377 n=1 Tax=Diorhabda carinulata TaxID=1163345 RepID=UPI0025A14354|nr:uncharacterized protein LOC130899377 [Diorhabda carinulata]
MSTNNSTKARKNSKDGDKKKFLPQPSTSDSNNINDKGPLIENDCKMYTGIGPDIIRNCAEQSMFESHLTEDVCNTLSEDINYKLRYIINDALLKARLCGRDVISSRDIEETFSNLSIEKVYGAKIDPNWVPFSDLPSTSSSDQTLFYLDDSLINLIELAEDESTYVQYGDVELIKQWYPDPNLTNTSPALKEYFRVACESIMGIDHELCQIVLKDISENPDVGPILQWFYNFAYLILLKNIRYDSLTLRDGYFLLVKDVSYDYLTLRSLELIETLENSPLGSANVSTKSLQLLIKLLLEKLLLESFSSTDLLSRMCFTLSIMCLRVPLKQLVIDKINWKLESLNEGTIFPILTIVYYLGIDGIIGIFLPRITFFLDRLLNESNSEMVYIAQAIYGLICKAALEDTYIYNWFNVIIPNELVLYWRPKYYQVEETDKIEMNFIKIKSKLIKTRRKIEFKESKRVKCVFEQTFDLPSYDCHISRKIQESRMGRQMFNRKESNVTVGKTSLILSILNGNNNNKAISKCCDHSLLSYNI